MRIKPTRIAWAAAVSFMAGGICCPGIAQAQKGVTSPSRAAGAGATMVTATAPDVQIVVSPNPEGHWVVAAVYPNKTDRKKAEARAKEMLALGKWKGIGLLFENKALDRIEESKETKPLPVISSATVSTPANIVDYASGTISLEPFIRAYRDLNQLNILFLIPGTFKYRGPKSYNDRDITLNYGPGGSALTFVVQIKNHDLAALNLPRFEPAAARTSPAAARPKSGDSRMQKMVAVIGIALAAAGIAFFGVQRWNTR